MTATAATAAAALIVLLLLLLLYYGSIEYPSEQQVQLLLDKTFLAEQLIHKMQYFVSAATQEAFYKAKDLLRTYTSSVIFLLKQ